MSSYFFRINTETHKEIKTFIIKNILTTKNICNIDIKLLNDKRGDGLYYYFTRDFNKNAGAYYEMFKKQYIHDKKFKSKLYLDAKYTLQTLMGYSEEDFEEFVTSHKGGKLEACFIAVSLGTINAIRHDGVLHNLVNRYHTKIFNLAINKLKRNRIVNEGFLLKVSKMKCGMF